MVTAAATRRVASCCRNLYLTRRVLEHKVVGSIWTGLAATARTKPVMALQQQRFLTTVAPPVSHFTEESSSSSTAVTTTTHFGFELVDVKEKESKVRQVFDNVADSYDVMNDLMSAGLHRYWKDYLLQISAVEAMAKAVRRNILQNTNNSTTADETTTPQLSILDVAGGTGDVAFRFVDAAKCLERTKSSGTDPIQITVCDINTEMLRVGERRARERYGDAILDQTKGLRFMQGNAQDLTTVAADNSFDMYTIAFGLRNVTDVDKALCEAHRVLKPGGRFMCLEFSKVEPFPPGFREIYDLYSFHVIPAMGQVVANDRASYQYLVESIRQFSNQEELCQRMRQAGMQHVKYTNLTGGIVAIHEGWKDIE